VTETGFQTPRPIAVDVYLGARNGTASSTGRFSSRRAPQPFVLLRPVVETSMKKLFIVLALSSGLALSACNTLRGAANDAESVGDCADGKKGNC
jgi:predicted small secreted protein